MNIESAKITIDKMASFLPEWLLNDIYKDHDAVAHIISKDDSEVVFSVVFNNGDKRILTVTIKRHEINVHYNGTMGTFSKLITADFYSDALNVLFPEELKTDTVKKAIVSMLNDYQDIKNMHWFLNHVDKKAIVLKAIDNAFNAIHPLLNEVQNMHDVPFNITADLIAYETWLLRLTKSYSTDLEITDISFKCRYELPQSGYDCVYLDYESDKPFLSLI